MGQLKIMEIAAQVKEWELLQELPKDIEGFTLDLEQSVEGQVLTIASYNNVNLSSKLELIYTTETSDYILVKTIGLNTFRDIRYFCRDRDKFAELVKNNLPRILLETKVDRQHLLHKLAQETGISNWEHEKNLPEQVGDFRLFIRPSNPIDYINGSTIVLDYSDFKNGNQLVFFYNSFRNEFFAETKKKYMPGITHIFDCKKVSELEKLLENLLVEELEKLASSAEEQ